MNVPKINETFTSDVAIYGKNKDIKSMKNQFIGTNIITAFMSFNFFSVIATSGAESCASVLEA